MTEEVVISIKEDALTYDAEPVMHGWYKHQKLSPQEGVNAITIDQSGGQTATYLTPGDAVINFSESILEGVLTPAAGGVNNYNWFVNVLGSWIRQLVLSPTAGSNDMINVAEWHHYAKIALPYLTTYEDFKTLDPLDILCPSHVPQSQNKLVTGANAAIAYEDIDYLISGNATNAQVPVIYYRIPLKMFKGTFFDVNKDLWYGQQLQLQFLFEAANKFLFTSTDNTNPLTGVATFVNTCANSAVIQLAIQQDRDVQDYVKAKCKAGLTIPIPFIKQMVKMPIAGAGAANFTYPITKANGIRALRVFNAIYPLNEVGASNNLLDNSNYTTGGVGGSKLNQLQTQFDSDYLQQIPMNVGGGVNAGTVYVDDYERLQKRLRGSVIQNMMMYYNNWTWVDDFTAHQSRKQEDEDLPLSNKIQGRDISDLASHTYYWNSNATSAGNYYSYLQSLKLLSISAPDGQSMVSIH